MEEPTINHVSDTALWVAYFRAEETERADALFRDPFAKLLSGEKGRTIAESMKGTSRYTAWTLSIRTYVIDNFLRELLTEGVDTVLNLGTGLDARPYRMELPTTLRWIEVDYPHLIDHKEKLLANEKPRCRLERVRLDLADRRAREMFFQGIAAQTKKCVVLTEGVIPYLTEDQVGELGDDLARYEPFRFWIAEYFSANVYKYLNTRRRKRQMRNAPFRFNPKDWFGFFKTHGWVPRDIKYLQEESIRLRRKIPMPWWAFFFRPFIAKHVAKEYRRYAGYVIYKKNG